MVYDSSTAYRTTESLALKGIETGSSVVHRKMNIQH